MVNGTVTALGGTGEAEGLPVESTGNLRFAPVRPCHPLAPA